MRQNGSNLNGRSGARPTARRDLGQLPSGQRKRHRKPGAMYLNHSRGFSDRSARIGNGRTPRRPSRLPYALIAVGCALVLFVAAVVGYVNRSVDVVLNGQETAVRVGSTLQNLIDDQELTDTYDAGDLLAVDDSVLTRHGGEKLSVKVDGKRIKQGKWKSRELTGGEKVTVKDGRDTYEKHEVQATVIEPKLKVEGTGAIEYVKTWGIQGRSEVWVGEQSGKTQDRGEVVPATDCVVECASVAPKGNEKYVALTFDEGPSGATKQILRVLKEKGVTAMDIAKALLDNGIHPPTMYFPLIVEEALMVEPTETETRETLDHAIEVFRNIYIQAQEHPEQMHELPLHTPVRRLDEVGAARNPKLRYTF